MSTPSTSPSWVVAATEILVVGLPFGAFKLLTGVVALEGGAARVLGFFLIALGVLDLLLNVVNLGSLLITKRRATDVCVLAFLVRRFDRSESASDLGIALDVFLSFALVAAVIALGVIGRMPSWARSVWNVAVVLNVLGAGVGRLLGAIRQRRPR